MNKNRQTVHQVLKDITKYYGDKFTGKDFHFYCKEWKYIKTHHPFGCWENNLKMLALANGNGG